MFFRPRTVQQVATLPFIAVADGFEVLLITSRNSGRWLLPKGWPSAAHSLAETARREAAEEAGVVGTLHRTPVGSYSYVKHMRQGYRVRCQVFVFLLLVRLHCLSWPERTERKLRWSGLAEAARLVEYRGLARLLADLSERDCAPLRAAFGALNEAPGEPPACPTR